MTRSKFAAALSAIAFALLLVTSAAQADIQQPTMATAKVSTLVNTNGQKHKHITCKRKYGKMKGAILSTSMAATGDGTLTILFPAGGKEVIMNDTPLMDSYLATAETPGTFAVRFEGGIVEMIAVGGPLGCDPTIIKEPRED